MAESISNILENANPGYEVSIVGVVRKVHRKSQTLDYWSLEVEDNTGRIFVRIKENEAKEHGIGKGTHIKVTGTTGLSKRNTIVIMDTDDVRCFGLITTTLDELPEKMRESASRMMLSSISRALCRFLNEENFREFECRVISKDWHNEGLEPLKVVYPGFGSPANLITSPSSQLLNFMNQSLLLRVFTDSYSFTTTYRYPNGSVESRVVMAKSSDISIEDCINFLKKGVAKAICHSDENANLPHAMKIFEKQDDSALNINYENVNIISRHKSFKSKITKLIKVYDANNIVLAEACEEKLDKDNLYTIVYYPDRFLEYLNNPITRNLSSLAERNPNIR